MEIKRRLIIKGIVQKVGFRIMVRELAQNLNMVGSVKNLRNGTVEIYCQCGPDTLEKFKEKLLGFQTEEKKDLKPEDITNPENYLKVKIDDIKQDDEKWEDFDESRLLFPFQTYSDDYSKETLERTDLGVLVMIDLSKTITKIFKNIDGKLEALPENIDKKIDKKFEAIPNNINECITSSFGELSTTYGTFDAKMDELIKLLKKIEKNTEKN